MKIENIIYIGFMKNKNCNNSVKNNYNKKSLLLKITNIIK